MAFSSYVSASDHSELVRAMTRPDAESLRQLVTLHRMWFSLDGEEAQSFLEAHDGLDQVFDMEDDPDRGLAYVSLAAAECDDRDFLSLIAALCLEDILRQPSSEIIGRVEAEARRSERFRWLIGGVYAHAMSEEARDRLLPLAISADAPLPPRTLA